MSGSSITFRVDGAPAPQGSKRYLGRTDSGKTRVAESSKRVAPWRADVRAAAEDAIRRLTTDSEAWRLSRSPLVVQVTFWLPRPRGHYRTGRNAGQLRDSAPEYPATKPDIDKLERAVLDALTGVLWADDNQIVHLSTSKVYEDNLNHPGALIYAAEIAR